MHHVVRTACLAAIDLIESMLRVYAAAGPGNLKTYMFEASTLKSVGQLVRHLLRVLAISGRYTVKTVLRS